MTVIRRIAHVGTLDGQPVFVGQEGAVVDLMDRWVEGRDVPESIR